MDLLQYRTVTLHRMDLLHFTSQYSSCINIMFKMQEGHIKKKSETCGFGGQATHNASAEWQYCHATTSSPIGLVSQPLNRYPACCSEYRVQTAFKSANSVPHALMVWCHSVVVYRQCCPFRCGAFKTISFACYSHIAYVNTIMI